MNVYKNIKQKHLFFGALFLTLIFVLLITLLTLANRPYTQEPINVSEYTNQIYAINSYWGTKSTLQEFEEDTYLETIIFTKDEGLMFLDENYQPNEFQFKRQNIYKNFEGKWELFLYEREFEPGSLESIFQLTSEDMKNVNFAEVQDYSTCIRLKLEKNCVVIQHKDEVEKTLYFQKDTKTLKSIILNYNENDSEIYVFSDINNPKFSVNGMFAELEEEIRLDVEASINL